MATYSLKVINNSVNKGDITLFQSPPDDSLDLMSTAWLTKLVNPNTTLQFIWEQDYNLVWDETGNLEPGVTFNASQVVPASLKDNNEIMFTKRDGAYQFINQKKAANDDAFIINCDGTIPNKKAAVGIGMSGAPILLRQAQPNINFSFIPSTPPKYWITFGKYTQGQVIDTTIIYAQSASIVFPANVYKMTATLNPDNTWTITPN